MGNYKVVPVLTHYEVYDANNDFLFSADTHREVVEELTILLSEQD